MWCYPAPIFPHCQYTEIIHKSDYHTAVDDLDHLKSSHLKYIENILFCSHEYLESLECRISKCLSTVFSLMVSLLNSFRDNNSIYQILWSLFSFKNNNFADIFDLWFSWPSSLDRNPPWHLCLLCYNSNKITKTWIQIQWCSNARVSVQGVKSLGGHFACLCRGFDFYEVKN